MNKRGFFHIIVRGPIMKLTDETNKVIDTLRQKGYRAYLVGGSVRDFFLDKESHDFDINTDARPEDIKEAFKEYKIVDTGIKHGSLSLIMDGKSFEITSFRRESDYSDRRRPDYVTFIDSLYEDLSRRDFTINAIAYNEEEGFKDPFKGIKDIENKIIRAVGKADLRFEEDPLRILRALCFASVLDFDIESKTRDSIFLNKDLLNTLPKERVRAEINKMICGRGTKKIILDYFEVLAVIIPEIKEMKDFDQRSPYHSYDLLTHTALVVENIEASLVLRYAALLHDIGKLTTFSLDENGIGHFYSHARESYIIGEEILNRLGIERKAKEKILALIKYHDMPFEEDKIFLKKRLSKFGQDFIIDLIKLQKADNLGQNPEYAFRQKELEAIEAILDEIIKEEACLSIKDLEINGEDLIGLGMKEGKEIGLFLKKLLNAVIEGKTDNDEKSLLAFASKLLEEN